MGTIIVRELGKAYKRYPSPRARLLEWLMLGMKSLSELHWVLRGIDFDINPGQSVGIVGANGAGKSTLLKLITGTVQPTAGTVEVKGRVTALLELGMGFHPLFTGRQNVRLAGQLIGIPSSDIERLLPEIAAFADIGPYLDEPLRVYSSGMSVRLAFALATAVRPDILIVDEALSVGDAAFQRKCFRRIEEFIDSGTTLLFVSHSIETVKRLCHQAIFLHQGAQQAVGNAKDVCDEYERTLFGSRNSDCAPLQPVSEKPLQDPLLASTTLEKQYGDGGALIESVAITVLDGVPANVIPESTPFAVEYRIRFLRDVERVVLGIMIKNAEGTCIYATNTWKSAIRDHFSESELLSVRFALAGNLVPGTYYLNAGAMHTSNGAETYLHRRVDCLIFRITAAHSRYSAGYANLFGDAKISLLPTSGRKV